MKLNKIYTVLIFSVLHASVIQASHIQENIDFQLSKEARKEHSGHSGGVFWLTGLSGAGKSTIARLAEKELFYGNKRVVVLDGDGLRMGLNNDLGFSQKDREENIRRVREMAKYLADAGNIVITSLISPYEKDRQVVKMYSCSYVIYVKAQLDVCRKRDPKGLYQKVDEGLIKEFTGITSPYDEPAKPDLIIDTEALSPTDSARQLIGFIEEKTK